MSDEQLKYVANLMSQTIDLERENKQLKFQLQQKENIIKEVRELIKTGASYCENGCVDDLSINDCNKILEILDKGE